MGRLRDARNAAENEYLNTVKEAADTQMQQANDMDNFNAFSNEAVEKTQEQAELEKDIDKSIAADTDKRTKLAQDAQRAVDLRDLKNEEYQKNLKNSINNKFQKNQMVLGWKQFASKQAKMKYDLAAQRLQEAQAKWANTAKILTSLGCTVLSFTGVGGAAAAGLSALSNNLKTSQ